jgi:thiosulfate/3-mercaptopyruvate sulfurtransferase
MRLIRALVCGAVLVTGAGAVLPAASPRDALVVSAAWLAQHLSDPNLVVLQAGDKAEYDARHVPGARYVTLDDVSVSDHEFKGDGLMLQMPAVSDLHDRLVKLGISDTSRIIVYTQKSFTTATRVLFTLDYAGLGDRVSLLDGGLDAWAKDGRPVSKDVPAPKPGALAPLKVKPEVVDAAYVFAHLKTPHVVIIDARAPAFYDGVQTGNSMGHPHRTGHIAGAVNVPYTQVTNDQAQLKSPEELAALFAKAGAHEGDTIIGYCHIGQQASAMLFAARTLGYAVQLYDGSFEDWSTHTDYPVEKKGGGV